MPAEAPSDEDDDVSGEIKEFIIKYKYLQQCSGHYYYIPHVLKFASVENRIIVLEKWSSF